MCSAFLNRGEVGGVRRQIDQLCPAPFYRLSHSTHLVCPQVVHHDNVSSFEGWAQHRFDINFKDLSVCSSIYRHQRAQATAAQAGQPRNVRPVVLRDAAHNSFPAWRPPIQPHQRQIYSRFINKLAPLRVPLGTQLLIITSRLLDSPRVALRGVE